MSRRRAVPVHRVRHERLSILHPLSDSSKKENPHEQQRYISRRLPRQQEQPENDSVERAPRSGTKRQDAKGNRSLESQGGEASSGDRQQGRPAG